MEKEERGAYREMRGEQTRFEKFYQLGLGEGVTELPGHWFSPGRGWRRGNLIYERKSQVDAK